MLIPAHEGVLRRIIMRRNVRAVLAAFLAVLTVLSVTTIGAYAALEGFSVKITAPKDYVPVGYYLQLSAEISVPEGSDLTADDFDIKWSTLDSNATITSGGLVFGITAGKTTVRVDVTEPESGETFSKEMVLNVTNAVDAVNSYLNKNTVLGYRYNTKESFYFYDQDNTWQSKMGFMNAFDFVSPYTSLVYDYVRVNYNYDGEAKMVQLWKGQYGLMFYGSEIGYYRMDRELGEDEEVGPFTYYKCATQDKIPMQTTLYWDKHENGNYEYEFTVPYDNYWWCTGFRAGHLWNTEPCDELRMEGFIDFHDETEANAFCTGLDDCGFKRCENASTLELDSYAQDGNRVSFMWQNISEAQNTKVVKTTLNVLMASGGFAMLFMPLGFLFMSFISMLGIMILL